MHRRYLFLLALAWHLGITTAGNAALQPNERLSLVRLGMQAIEQWDLIAARRALEQAAASDPNDTLVQYFRAQVLFHEGDYTGAAKVLDGLPTTPVVHGAEEFAKLVRATAAATAGMVRHDTPHFSIFYVPGRDDILVPYAEETLEAAYERIGNDLQWKPTERVRIEIYPDSDRFTAVTTLTKQEIETSGTIALCKFNRLMITTPRVLVRGYGWRDTLTHEYVHYVLSRKTKNQVPLWLHEGIAKFEEARWREEEIAKLSPISESLLAEALEKNYFITIEQMYPSLAKLKSAQDTQLAFAEVETMVGFLVRKGGYPMLRKLVDQLSAGYEDGEALRAVGGWAGIDAFLAEWKSYLRERGLKRIAGLTILKTKLVDGVASEDREDLRAVPDKTSKQHLRLGDELRDRRRFAAAVVEYRKAKDMATGINPVIHHKLGLAQMLAGDVQGAIATFHEALAVYPTFGPLHRRLGEAFANQKKYAEARRHLELAIGVNPFDPAVHALLAEIYHQLGETPKAERERQVFSLLKG